MLKRKIWTAKLRIGRAVILQASAPRIFNAAALVAAEGLGVTVLAAVVALAVIALVAAALAEAALADSAAADPGADDDINVLNLVLYFFKKVETTTTLKPKPMKKLLTLTGIASISMVLAIISASEATAASASEISRKEALLAQSGFKVVTVTTPKQKEAVNGLAQGRCSAVTYNGKMFYVFPTATKDKFYVGKQKHFNKYKQAIATQQASKPAR